MKKFFSLAALIYALDFFSKELIRSQMPLGEEISVWPFFSLVHVQNTGIAFGFFQGRNFAFLIIGIVIAAVLIAVAFKTHQKDPFSVAVMGVVLGAAFGNLTDRFRHGYVTDFLDFYIGTYHWPAFNVADAAICIGAGLLIVQSIRQGKHVSHSF